MSNRLSLFSVIGVSGDEGGGWAFFVKMIASGANLQVRPFGLTMGPGRQPIATVIAK